MVLLSLRFHMKGMFCFCFIPIVKNGVLFTSYFCIFLLVVVIVFLHSCIACHKLFRISVKRINSVVLRFVTPTSGVQHLLSNTISIDSVDIIE